MQRDRAYRREQMDRMAEKRIRQYRNRFGQKRIEQEQGEGWRIFSPGMFANEQPHMGCHKARCMICNGDRLLDPRRTREERAWRAVEGLAYGGGQDDFAIEAGDWSALRADDEMCGLPATVEDAVRPISQDYARVYDRESGICLGDLSDMDTAWTGDPDDTGEAIVEVETDYGNRYWIAADKVEVR